jgi:hypothetical protein
MTPLSESRIVASAIRNILDRHGNKTNSSYLSAQERLYIGVILQAAKDYWAGRDVTSQEVNRVADLAEEDLSLPPGEVLSKEQRKKHTTNANKLNTRRIHSEDAYSWLMSDAESSVENLELYFPQFPPDTPVCVSHKSDGHRVLSKRTGKRGRNKKELDLTQKVMVSLPPGEYVVSVVSARGKSVAEMSVTPVTMTFITLCDILGLNGRLLRELIEIRTLASLEEVLDRFDRHHHEGDRSPFGGDPLGSGPERAT